jgi:hypothetical protein
VDENNFDELETEEIAGENPALVASMHAALLKLIGF